MIRAQRPALAAALAAAALMGLAPQAESVPEVDPAELSRRADLAGKQVVVDDRVVYFQYHKGQGYDELVLRRAPGVIFRLPASLRPAQPPRAPAARVRGLLRRDGEATVVDVSRLDLLPDDLERVEQAVAPLPPDAFEERARWGRWARDRAESYKDDTIGAELNRRLAARGLQLEVEALRLEADRAGVADRASDSLELARKGRRRGLPDPEPAALAHRGVRARLATAKSAAELDRLPEQVLELLPNAGQPTSGDTSAWAEAYARDPAAAYRSAPPEVRKSLDRQLYADAVRASLEAKAAEAPESAITLADRARELVPERPELAAALRDRGLAAATRDVGSLGEATVTQLAARYRDELRRPDRADELLRAWLEAQHAEALGSRDAERRIYLANLYRRWLKDDRAAAVLLRAALEIDPASREASDLFRRMGYRKVDNQWVEPTALAAGAGAAAVSPDEVSTPSAGGALIERDMTRAQVRARLGGKPDSISRVATQGQIVEQWTYLGAKSKQVINFRQQLGRPQPTVWNYYQSVR